MQCFLSHWFTGSRLSAISKIQCRSASNFSREAKFRRKKIGEKSRFGELSTEEIQEIMDNAVPVTTTKGDKVWDDII